MFTTPFIAPLAAVLVAAGALTATATSAEAATSAPATGSGSSTTASSPAAGGVSTSGATHLGKGASLQAIQSAGAAATAKRITSLTAAIAKVNDDKTLTASDRSTVLGTLNTDLAGMQRLQSAIAADTTAAQAHTDFSSIFTQYRVYVVALRQTAIVREADRATADVPQLAAAEQKLSAALTKHASKSTAATTAALADLQTQIGTIQSDSQGLSAATLAVTPSAWDSQHTAMASVEATAATLRTAEGAAHKDVTTIRAALKG